MVQSMLNPPPIDYDALRVTMVKNIATATGLSSGNVIMLDGENPNWPRPNKPYIGLQTVTAAMRYGDDDFRLDSESDDGTDYIYTGQRGVVIGFDAFGTTHEQANGLMCLWQACLMQDPTLDALRAAGVAVWNIGSVVAMSALLNTAYEGRAHMDVTFGLCATMRVNLGRIDTVPVTGNITADSGQIVNVSTTLKTTGG